MKLHIVTVAYEDSDQLFTTYGSCNLGDRLNVCHWIFIRRYDLSLVEKYPRAIVRPSDDAGIYNAMNLAFDHLKEKILDDDIVVFMNAGDCFIVDPLVNHILTHTEKCPEISVAGTWLTRNGEIIGQRTVVKSSDPGAIIYRNYPCHQATFYCGRFLKETFARRGFLYREDLCSCADLELYLYAQGNFILFTLVNTTYYDVNGFSSKQSLAIAAEKLKLLGEYKGNLRWHLYAKVWSLRARLVEPKKRLRRILKCGFL